MEYYNYSDSAEECDSFANKALLMQMPNGFDGISLKLQHFVQNECIPYRIELGFPSIKAIEGFDNRDEAELVKKAYLEFYEDHNVTVNCSEEEVPDVQC